MNIYEFKKNLISRLFDRDIYTRRVSDVEIQTRCPWCGDSVKDNNTGHLYIKINQNDNLPIVYNCFKCPASGVLKYDDLEMLGIRGDDFKDLLTKLNKNKKLMRTNVTEEKFFNFKIPNPNNLDKIRYVENRLGYNFSFDDLNDIKIITSLKDFLMLNDINYITCKPTFAKMLERQYVGFLSGNNGHILFRDITNSNQISWFKYKILNESSDQKVYYSIPSEADLYTTDEIHINLSEGVMDCLSIAYNLQGKQANNFNIAVCGKFYANTIKNLLCKGLVGDNIVINIYSDNDHNYDTSVEGYQRDLSKYKYLVKEINIHYNLLNKDCGVTKDQIKLQTFKI